MLLKARGCPKLWIIV